MAALPLLAPAGHQQQRVVHRHPQPDQGDQVLHQEADLGDLGQAKDGQEGCQDRDGGDQQRHEGQQRPEHEGEHHQGAEGADQRLDQHAALCRLRFRLRRQLVQPGDLDLGAGREAAAQPLGDSRPGTAPAAATPATSTSSHADTTVSLCRSRKLDSRGMVPPGGRSPRRGRLRSCPPAGVPSSGEERILGCTSCAAAPARLRPACRRQGGRRVSDQPWPGATRPDS
jgi:hypothetical protein